MVKIKCQGENNNGDVNQRMSLCKKSHSLHSHQNLGGFGKGSVLSKIYNTEKDGPEGSRILGSQSCRNMDFP